MIRPAKFTDIPRIVELMHEMHERSRYRDIDKVSDKVAHRLVAQCVQRHGHMHDGGANVMVAVKDSKVEGFMIGMLDRTYHIGSKLMACDLFLYLSKKADPRDALSLVGAYTKWASTNPKVIEIKLSWTDAIEGAYGIEPMYKHFGFKRCGAIWARDNVATEQEEAA